MSLKRKTNAEEVLAVLIAAHRKMDELGYPPVARPIDDRERAA